MFLQAVTQYHNSTGRPVQSIQICLVTLNTEWIEDNEEKTKRWKSKNTCKMYYAFKELLVNLTQIRLACAAISIAIAAIFYFIAIFYRSVGSNYTKLYYYQVMDIFRLTELYYFHNKCFLFLVINTFLRIIYLDSNFPHLTHSVACFLIPIILILCPAKRRFIN